MTDDISYTGALVDFLDRETGCIKKTVMYPITRIQLQDLTDEGIVEGREFIVENGRWVEVN